MNRYLIQEWYTTKGLLYMVCDCEQDFQVVFTSKDRTVINRFLTCLDGK